MASAQIMAERRAKALQGLETALADFAKAQGVDAPVLSTNKDQAMREIERLEGIASFLTLAMKASAKEDTPPVPSGTEEAGSTTSTAKSPTASKRAKAIKKG